MYVLYPPLDVGVRVITWVSVTVGAPPAHSLRPALTVVSPSAVPSVAVNGNMTHPVCSPERIIEITITPECK